MGGDETTKAPAPGGFCLCVPCNKRSRQPWTPPDCAATSYEIRCSHSRRFLSQRSGSSGRGFSRSNSRSAGAGTPRPPKLGSTEPQLSCYMLQQQQELPQQQPAVLCPACAAAAGSWSSCFFCCAKEAPRSPASMPSSSNLLHVPSCSSQGSNSFHDSDSEIASFTASKPAVAPAATLAADTADPRQLQHSNSRNLRLHMSRSSSFKSRFPCVDCWRCSNSCTISLKVLQLQTASGSIIPALFLRHPSARQTLLVSHRSNSDLGRMYPLLLFLCRSLCVNVLGYEYTGYGFCCCTIRRNHSEQQEQQQQRRLCRPSTTGVNTDIRAAFLWLQQQQQQTPQSIILYSEGKGLLPALQLRSELAAEGLQLGGLVFVAPAATAAGAASTATGLPLSRVKGKEGGEVRRIRRLVPACLRRRSETHEVYMQLLQLHLDELLVLEGFKQQQQEAPCGKTPQLLLRQRAAAAATVAETGDLECTCSDFPTGDNLRRLKAFVLRSREQQEQQELAMERHYQIQQQQQQLLLAQRQQQQKLWCSVMQTDHVGGSNEQQHDNVLSQQPQQAGTDAYKGDPATNYPTELVSPPATTEGTPEKPFSEQQQLALRP